MEMIERYIYAVTKKLREKQRRDVADELRGLIEDMLNERVQDSNIKETDVEEVLLELGHPASLARKYKDGKKYLIGPDVYDLYILVLKIGLISVIAVFSAIFVIQTMLNPENILDYFINYIISFFTTTIPIVVGWTTLGFAIAEYFSAGKLEKIALNNHWEPSNLSPVPRAEQQIKRHEAITGIVIYLLIMAFLTFSNDYFGVWLFEDGTFSEVIPFLNEATFGSFLLFILIIFGFGIVKECLKLIYEKWTLTLVLITVIVNIISIVLIVFMILGEPFWNPNFMNELVQHGFVNKGTDEYDTVRIIWEQLTRWTVILFMIGLVWDMIKGFIKFRKANIK